MIEVVSIAPSEVQTFEEEPLAPFSCGPITDRTWSALAANPRVMPKEMYTEYLQSLEYSELQQHARVRRKHTGEDLNAKAAREDLIGQMRFDDPDD